MDKVSSSEALVAVNNPPARVRAFPLILETPDCGSIIGLYGSSRIKGVAEDPPDWLPHHHVHLHHYLGHSSRLLFDNLNFRHQLDDSLLADDSRGKGSQTIRSAIPHALREQASIPLQLHSTRTPSVVRMEPGLHNVSLHFRYQHPVTVNCRRHDLQHWPRILHQRIS